MININTNHTFVPNIKKKAPILNKTRGNTSQAPLKFGNKKNDNTFYQNGLAQLKKDWRGALIVTIGTGIGACFFPPAWPIVPIIGLTYLTCSFIWGGVKKHP